MMPVFEPVAWLRDTLDGGLSTMTDCCTDNVKNIWLRANPKQVERYTAPLFTEAQLTAAYEQGKRDAIPDGFVLVPKEPTREMLKAAQSKAMETGDYIGSEYWTSWYKAMIAAAQEKP